MLYNKDFVQLALNNPKLEFMYKEIKKIQNIKILELGVERGVSTSMFLKLCEQNNGRIISVDIENCANLFQNDRWNFIQSRDDNFEIINKEILKMEGLDVVYIDSFHEPNHVKKLFYNYYKLLNKNGFIFIDDISWLPYAISSYPTNNWVHEMNLKTFEKLLEIKFSNNNKINIEFNFEESGIAKITKKNDEELNEPKKINSVNTIRSLLRKYYQMLFRRK